MAKKLTEIQKTYDGIQSDSDKIVERLTKINTNFWNHNGMMFEGLDSLDERVAELQKSGKKGTTVGDFMDDADIKLFVKGVDDLKKFCRKESDEYYAELEKLKKLKKDLDKLGSDVDDVLKARKFKISKSKGALKDIGASIKSFAKQVSAIAGDGGPHLSSNKLLN